MPPLRKWEIQAQRRQATCLGSHSKVVELRRIRQPEARLSATLFYSLIVSQKLSGLRGREHDWSSQTFPKLFICIPAAQQRFAAYKILKARQCLLQEEGPGL